MANNKININNSNIVINNSCSISNGKIMINGLEYVSNGPISINGNLINGRPITDYYREGNVIYCDKIINNTNNNINNSYDETKIVQAFVQKLIIETDIADVSIALGGSEFMARLFSDSLDESSLTFDVIDKKDKVLIKEEYKGISSDNIKLEVLVPYQDYESIEVNTKSGEISFNEEINIKNVNLESLSGNIYFSGNGEKLDISSLSGKIDIQDNKFINAYLSNKSGDIIIDTDRENDLSINAETLSGNICMNIKNSSVDCKHQTLTGKVRIDDLNGSYNSRIKVSSLTGDITIK